MNDFRPISRGDLVFFRASLNVPITGSEVADDYRLSKVIPVLSRLREQQAIVILCGHIGRSEEDSLGSVFDYLGQHVSLSFEENFFKRTLPEIDNFFESARTCEPGSIILLDNVRQSPREKNDDQELAERMAKHIDWYVNDAFAVAHRQHMSVSALAKACEKTLMGPTFKQEIEVLDTARNTQDNSIAVISGNKFDTKLPLIEKLIERYQTIVVGGALANTLYWISGHEIGRSLHDDQLSDENKARLETLLASDKLYLPELVTVERGNGTRAYRHVSQVTADDTIYDADPRAFDALSRVTPGASLLLWNGPLGYYEKGYTEGSNRMLELFAQSEGLSIIGGGNTVDFVRHSEHGTSINHLSTGGGAMIEYLIKGNLPAIDALGEYRSFEKTV